MRIAGIVLAALLTLAAGAQGFPPGTAMFFETRATSAIPANGGGVWAATNNGITRYTASGAGVTVPTPDGSRPSLLALAADGSIWFATPTMLGRMSASGVPLEQYPQYGTFNARSLAVATDGALWYGHDYPGSYIGRIAGGAITKFDAPGTPWSLAPAEDRAVWILTPGFGSELDALYWMDSTGAITALPLGHDVLFGTVQTLPDGTLYVGTGIRKSVLRRTPGSQTFEEIPLPYTEYVADADGNLWTGGIGLLGFIDRLGTLNVRTKMPLDPRDCSTIPVWLYSPEAIDSEGGVWVRIFNTAFYLPEPIPCNEPEPPPMPDLIRIDSAQFLRNVAKTPGEKRRRRLRSSALEPFE
jgi:streptogramin lyase